jgi:hypothetical protein
MRFIRLSAVAKLSVLVSVAVSVASCERAAPRPARDTTPQARVAAPAVESCFRSATSVLGRTTPLTGHGSVSPGWLRFGSAPVEDSGTVQLVDADGATFPARWRRIAADSIEIRGRDDFMEVSIRAAVSDTAIAGTGVLTSDADVQRNAAGQLEPLRREWRLSAPSAPCGGVPAAAR